MYIDIGLHVKYRLFLPILMKLEFYRHTYFEKYSNIKFMKNPSSEWRETDGRTDTPKLVVAFRNFLERAQKLGYKIMCCTIKLDFN